VRRPRLESKQQPRTLLSLVHWREPSVLNHFHEFEAICRQKKYYKMLLTQSAASAALVWCSAKTFPKRHGEIRVNNVPASHPSSSFFSIVIEPFNCPILNASLSVSGLWDFCGLWNFTCCFFGSWWKECHQLLAGWVHSYFFGCSALRSSSLRDLGIAIFLPPLLRYRRFEAAAPSGVGGWMSTSACNLCTSVLPLCLVH